MSELTNAKIAKYEAEEGRSDSLQSARDELVKQISRLENVVDAVYNTLALYLKENDDLAAPLTFAPLGNSTAARDTWTEAERVRLICNRLDTLINRLDV